MPPSGAQPVAVKMEEQKEDAYRASSAMSGDSIIKPCVNHNCGHLKCQHLRTIEGLKTRLGDSMEQIEIFTQKLKAKEELSIIAENENREMSMRLEKLQLDMESQQQERVTMEADRQDLLTKHAQLVSQLESLRSSLDVRQQEIARLSEEKQEVDIKVTELTYELETSMAERIELKQHLQQEMETNKILNKEQTQVRQSLQDEEKANQALRMQIEQLTHLNAEKQHAIQYHKDVADKALEDIAAYTKLLKAQAQGFKQNLDHFQMSFDRDCSNLITGLGNVQGRLHKATKVEGCGDLPLGDNNNANHTRDHLITPSGQGEHGSKRRQSPGPRNKYARHQTAPGCSIAANMTASSTRSSGATGSTVPFSSKARSPPRGPRADRAVDPRRRRPERESLNEKRVPSETASQEQQLQSSQRLLAGFVGANRVPQPPPKDSRDRQNNETMSINNRDTSEQPLGRTPNAKRQKFSSSI